MNYIGNTHREENKNIPLFKLRDNFVIFHLSNNFFAYYYLFLKQIISHKMEKKQHSFRRYVLYLHILQIQNKVRRIYILRNVTLK